jgi:hypothetical protein
MYSIKYKECTPFLGAGACAGVLPLGRDVAERWAAESDYPFSDRDNLVRVAQFLAVEKGPKTPKYKMLEVLAGKGPPDFTNKYEPHRVVADLELPIYITTNYDDFMTRALIRDVPKRVPRRISCPWFASNRFKSKTGDLTPEPTPDEPVVFHLHGTLDNVDSMVLTEDDYLDFLMRVSEVRDLIPPRIEDAFASSSLLFLGYSLEDMNFKVLFRKLAGYMQINQSARHVSVQLAPRNDESTEEQIQRAERQRKYLEKRFGLQKVKIYWATCEEFTMELRTKWEAFNVAHR